MRRNLISEWSSREHSGQLFIVENKTKVYEQQQLKPEESMEIVLELGCDSHKGSIRFRWGEGEALIQGLTEVLITTHGDLTETMLVGILLSKVENIYFGWSPFIVKDRHGLLLNQGKENVVVSSKVAIDFFRWLKHSLQLMGRIVW